MIGKIDILKIVSSFCFCLLLSLNTNAQSDSLSFINKIGDENLKKLRNRLLELNDDILNKGIIETKYSKNKLLTGYLYEQFYDWDLYFENIYMSYYDVFEFNFNNLEVFFSLQQPDGFMKRAFGSKRWGSRQMFKPFIAQIVLLGSRQTGNFNWAREYYPKMELYLKRWFEYDKDKNGLVHWPGNAAHSGMDNQRSRNNKHNEGADLNSYLVRELKAMAIIADELGYSEDSKEFMAHSKKLKELINKYLWDEKQGFYFDRNEKKGKPIYVKSVASFVPLWANISSEKQAKRLVEEHLLNTNEFWLQYPLATYSKTEPDYFQKPTRPNLCNWRGSAWIPVNYMICHGLLNYGYTEVSEELAYKTFNMVLNKNNSTREFYDAETGQGYGMNPFFGWSSLAYYLPLEIEMKYTPTKLEEKHIQKLAKKLSIQFKPHE